jgi:hypothetical protein
MTETRKELAHMPFVNSNEGLRASLYCAAEVIRCRQLAGQPVPEWLRRHHARLKGEHLSGSGHEIACGDHQLRQLSRDEWMGTADVSRDLGLSPRQVRRLGIDRKLDAQRISGGWIFSRASVIAYGRRKDDV